MIKDIIVNLAPGSSRSIAGEFALSVASAFNAHLTAVAFQYRFEVPGTMMVASTLGAIMDAQRTEGGKASRDAIPQFVQAAKAAGVAISCEMPETRFDDAPAEFAKLARACDLAVVRQPNPDESGPEELFAEGVLFGSGR